GPFQRWCASSTTSPRADTACCGSSGGSARRGTSLSMSSGGTSLSCTRTHWDGSWRPMTIGRRGIRRDHENVWPGVGWLRSRVKDNRAARALLFLAQTAFFAAHSRVAHSPVRRRADSPEHHLAAAIRVKDEARFLPEWLAHHHNLGVEHFFVYDNNSSDDIESVLAPFIERGLVTYIHWPKVPASPSCEIDFLSRFGHRCAWVAFFDADEFLFERTPGELKAVLREFGHKPA